MPIGVDFTGSVIRAGVVEDGSIVQSMTADTQVGAEPPEVLDTIARVVLALAPKPEMVGVAIPGEVNVDGRCWRLPNTVGFEGIPIGWEVSRRLGCPIAVENRATTAALAERLYGHGREHPSFLMVTLGTGIGGGIVIDGEVYHGASDAAGEFGHVTIDANGRRCKCGNYGCIEAYASGPAIAERAIEGIESGVDTSLSQYVKGDLSKITAQIVYEAANDGDEWALEVVHDTARLLGAAVASFINIFNPEVVVICGGVTQAGDKLFGPLRSEVKRRAFKPAWEVCKIVPGTLPGTAGVYGAAAVFIQSHWGLR